MINFIKNLFRRQSPEKRFLIEARSVISKGWTKGSLARLADGTPTFESDPCAVTFCLLGALNKAQNNGAGDGVSQNGAIVILNGALGLHHLGSLIGFNDAKETTRADVLALFDKAIKAA